MAFDKTNCKLWICQNTPFVDQIPKTYTASEVVGLGFLD